jgi:hypothetical protein
MIAATILLLATSPCYAFHSPNFRHSNLALPQSSSSATSFSIVKQFVHNRFSAQSDYDGEVSAQDVRLFLTQRCIQSFMFLLAATRDLHTVWWLDNFVQPITINNYWDDDVDHKPGAADTFRENDKRYVIILGKVQDTLFANRTACS